MKQKSWKQIRESKFGKWANNQTRADLDSYMWACLLYGPDFGDVWDIVTKVDKNNKLSALTVSKAITILTRKSETQKVA